MINDPTTPLCSDQGDQTPESNPEVASQIEAPAADINDPDDTKLVHAPHGKGEIFADTESFETLGLRSSVLKGIKEAGFERPTKTQEMLISR